MCNQSDFTSALAEHRNEALRYADRNVSRTPRAKDICALFAGVDVLASAARHWWSGEDKSLRALTEVGDDELSHLSECGRRLRREARGRRRLHGLSSPSALGFTRH